MIEVTVRRKRPEAEDVCGFELISTNGMPLPRFTAGTHVDVSVEPGLIRQYLLCNSPREDHRYLIEVLREPCSRGGSAAMHEKICVRSRGGHGARARHRP